MHCLILEANSIHMEVKKVIRSRQNGFTTGKSSSINTIAFCEGTNTCRDKGRALDVVYIDFRKAFNTVSDNIGTLRKCGLHEWTGRWIKTWLNGRS